MNEYDISAAFEEIEAGLIRSMARNFRGHRDWELSEGFNWPMWQAEQLKALERYRQEADKTMGGHAAKTDGLIDRLLETAFQDAAAEQERMILQAIRRGAHIPRPPGAGEDPDAFFRTSTRKLDALREAVKNDLHTAETATLRMAEDVYRKTIFNAQVYANTGAGTLWRAVDMAAKSFLAAGLGAIRYRDGRMVNAASYAEMAIRTANKRAYLTGEGAKRQEWGVSLVIVTRRGTGCPHCVQWQGRVYVDDVWSGGKADGKHPLLSTAIAGGLYHPNCKDSHTTFFPGVSTEPGPLTTEQRRRMVENYNLQQKQRYHERQVRKYKRLETGSLDPANVEKYKARRQEWQGRARELVRENPDVLRREYAREKVRTPAQNTNLTSGRLGGILQSSSDIQIGRSVGAAAAQGSVLLPDGSKGRLAQGSKITKVVTFAGGKTGKPVKQASNLSAQFPGVNPADWKKVRGEGFVECPDGKTRRGELHWFESAATGRIKMKVKRWFP